MPNPLRRAVPFLLSYGLYYFGMLAYTTVSRGATPETVVCIIGNAPDAVAAHRVFHMWGGRFAAVFYLWNATSPAREKTTGLTLIDPGKRRLTFVEGIEVALKQARAIGLTCNYYFTHDDDLYFETSASGTKQHVADIVLQVLRDYRPLIASFPWEAGLRNHRNLAQIHANWSAHEIGPMVAFDTGMIMYHSSIVDFFVPFAPRGEGGFFGHWTLGAHFINLFVTLAFRDFSLCMNSVRYRNAINIDNLASELRNDWKTDSAGLVHYKSGSRHPYEWPQNNGYKRFLASGLKCVGGCRWGRDLTLGDVRGWRPSGKIPSRLDVLREVSRVYHVKHDALMNNGFLSTFLESEVAALKLSFPYTLRINIFSFNRPASFERLWRSLTRALLWLHCNCTVTVHAFQDYDPLETPHWKKQKALIEQLKLDGVKVAVTTHSRHLGLRSTILSSWQPKTDDEFCLFLEDDIELADQALQYADRLIRQYWYAIPIPQRNVLGISLYRPLYSEVTESPVSFPPNSPLVLFEYPCSWGQVFAARPWNAFLDWYHNTGNSPLFLPDSYANRWPSSSSWKKALLRWMVFTGSVMIYPNLYSNLSLSTNHLESGTNDKLQPNSTSWVVMKAKFTVGLVPRGSPLPRQLPPIESLPLLDAWGNVVVSVQGRDVSSFDKCTVVMAVCYRVDTWADRIRHFQNASFISAFVVIWQNCIANRSMPVDYKLPTLPFSVRMHSTSNSLNNRFLPLLNTTTDCMISIDDDFDMPLQNISFAVATWRGHFWNNIVGFAGFGRNHFYDRRFKLWRYSTSGRENFSSILLPTCLVYHKKYQALYARLPQTVLDYVNEKMNCDDILFNFVVSNATKAGPVVVAGAFWPTYVTDVERLGGLWHRPNHFHVRSDCLNYFVRVFGEMPLRYTTSYFELERHYGSSPGVPPGLRHHKWSEAAKTVDADG